MDTIARPTELVHGQQPPAAVEASGRSPRAYDAVFALTYLANASLMVAVSLLFRYADFVAQAGGTAGHLGLIVGIGTVGALLVRIVQGMGIDRFGPRRVWLLSLALFVTSMAWHTQIDTVRGPAVYLARILMMIGLAGAFGASITFVSLRSPPRRMAEMIGTLGSSGFLGMALGPTLGDWIFADGVVSRLHVQRMFVLAAGAGAASLMFAALATRGQIRRPTRRLPSPVRVIRRYHPGLLLLAGIAMGWGIGLPHTFLRPYAASLQIDGLKSFFLVYAATAFSVRIGLRRLPDRVGVRATTLVGLACLAASMLTYLLVREQWMLALPALVAGTAHALLFPSVVAGGCASFPPRYRGVATTLILAMFDLGNLVGQPLTGGAIELARLWGWPQFATMFVFVAVVLGAVAVVYAAFGRPPQPPDSRRRTSRQARRRSMQRAVCAAELQCP